MVDIAVRCNDWMTAKKIFLDIAERIRKEPNMCLHWLVYDKTMVGNDKCRVRFFSINDTNAWIDSKFDKAIGFDIWEQKEILKEGCRSSRRFIKVKQDYTEEIWKYIKLYS